jgi:hypothetical protein
MLFTTIPFSKLSRLVSQMSVKGPRILAKFLIGCYNDGKGTGLGKYVA